MTYEEKIRETAARHGWEVYPDGKGLRLIDEDGNEAWHRLGTDAEMRHDMRSANPERYPEPGRWVAPLGNDRTIEWGATNVR